MEKTITMKKQKELRYSKWVGHLNNTRERTNYSIRRMDLLVISICGAGIYIIFETFKSIATKEIQPDNVITIKIAGILLLVSIISNFISQITGYNANTFEERYIHEELAKIEGKNYDEAAQKKYDTNSKDYSKWTNCLNLISIVFMLSGLVLLAVFNYLLF